MSNPEEKDFVDSDGDSDEEDEDYVPSDEEISADEEVDDKDYLENDDDEDGKKKKMKVKKVRKRGCFMMEENNSEHNREEEADRLLITAEKQEELKKNIEEKDKERADSLWSSFLKDTKTLHPKKITQEKPDVSVQDTTKKVESAKPAEKPKKVVVTQLFDFAGETVKVTKEVDAHSKEAKTLSLAEPATLQQSSSTDEQSSLPSSSGVKRPSLGIGSVLNKIGKKAKMSTLTKSNLDWDKFKTKEGINEELEVHNKGKGGYLEKQAFLERADYRQFEIERQIRHGQRNTKR